MELSNLMSVKQLRAAKGMNTWKESKQKLFKPSQMPQAAYASKVNALLGLIYIYIASQQW